MVVRAKTVDKSTKEQLHRLVDALPKSELHAARRFLEYLRNMRSDPVLRALLEAPQDDEPETEEERAAVRQAWQEYLRGQARPWEQVREELTRE